MSRRKELAAELRAWSINMRADISGGDMLTEAADLLDPPDDETTVEVRVLVRVGMDEGEIAYKAAGEGYGSGHRHPGIVGKMLVLDGFDQTIDTWITARVPTPAPVAEVEGTVDP